jgi:DNA-directed RNA polymerase specialized sigma24 family protein
VLHYYVGMSAPTLAETLGIPLGTAQSRLARALAALRAAIGTEAEPGAAAVARGHLA